MSGYQLISNHLGSTMKKYLFLIKIFYHIRYKYYQLQNFIKHFRLGKEEDRLQLIDSIDKLIKKERI